MLRFHSFLEMLHGSSDQSEPSCKEPNSPLSQAFLPEDITANWSFTSQLRVLLQTVRLAALWLCQRKYHADFFSALFNRASHGIRRHITIVKHTTFKHDVSLCLKTQTLVSSDVTTSFGWQAPFLESALWSPPEQMADSDEVSVLAKDFGKRHYPNVYIVASRDAKISKKYFHTIHSGLYL